MSSLSLWLEPEPAAAATVTAHIHTLAGKLGTETFAPHVTVIGGVSADEEHATQWTHDLASTMPSLDITFDAAGFEDVLVRAAYLKAELTPALTQLRTRAGELFDFPPDPYMPHMSLAYSNNVSKDTRRSAVNALGLKLPTTVRFTSIALWRTLLDYAKPDFASWTKVASAPLLVSGGEE